MSKKQIIIAVVALAVGVLIGALFLGGGNKSSSQGSAQTQGVEVWTCSMHPQIRQAEPGQCPVCGMNLIPAETSAEESPREIRMSPTAMQLASVRTSIVGQDMNDTQQRIRISGEVAPDERLIVTQTNHIEGRVEELFVDFTGKTVSRGQVLADIYAPKLVTAQEELLQAQKMKDVQPALFEAAKSKLKSWKLSEVQIQRILERNTTMDRFPIHADRSGVVLEKKVDVGDYLKVGSSMYSIADLSRVWILLDLYEKDLAHVKVGTTVEYTIDAFPVERFTAKVDFIDPILDQRTRTVTGRLSVSNPQGRLRPGMFVQAYIKGEAPIDGDALIIPKTAVLWTGERSVVYVKVSEADKVGFEMRQVTLGPLMGDHYAVTQGLMAGEEIVSHGAFSVDAAAQLAGKPSMMNPEGGAAIRGHDHGSMSSRTRSGSEKMDMTKEKYPLESDARGALDALFKDYFELKNALVGDDFESAIKKGSELKDRLSKIEMAMFEGDAHAAWMNRQGQLESALEHIHHRADIKGLRDDFIGISRAIIGLAKDFGTGSTIYVDYCPMVNDNTGASWLSEQEKILNPYFGASMLKCGKVTEIIQN